MLTDEQALLRQHSIGGSDVAAILGISPWQSAYDVWARLTGKLKPLGEEGEPLNEAIRSGNRLEPLVLDWAEEQLGPLERNLTICADELPVPMHCQVDGRVIATGRTVEAKTAGMEGPLTGAWGDPETDEIPEWYIVQCTQQMRLARVTDFCHVPAWLGGRGKVMYRVEWNPDLSEIILERCGEFWERCVQMDMPPSDSVPSLEMVKRFKRVPGKVISVPAELIDEAHGAREIAAAAERVSDYMDARVFGVLGDAEGDEAGRVTYFEQSGADTVDRELLRREYPAAWAACSRTNRFRVLRFRKVKGDRENGK